MHDRALIFFTDGETVSPAICLYRHGSQVPSILAATAAPKTRDPEGAANAIAMIGVPKYYATRFFMVCGDFIDENIGLGPERVDEELEVLLCRTVQPLAGLAPILEARRTLRTFSRVLGLEAGLVVANVSAATWSWRAFGGHLESTPRTSDSGWFEVHPV